MRKLIYAMGVSLDGFIASREGEIDWSVPDEELHRFHNEQTRELGVHLCGRRLHETMLPWESFESGPESMLEFARLWQALPKVVFSTTLTSVEGNARLGTVEEVARLKEESGKDIGVGGAGLAASLIDLIDEFGLFVSPVVLGGGTPFWPAVRIELELVETRTFGSRVVYLRYVRA